MIIHAVPSFIAPSEYGAGNWKATEATGLAIARAGLDSTRVVFDEHNPSMLLDHLTDDSDHAVIEYSIFPNLLQELRAARPRLGLHVRTHNAEPLQHLSRSVGGKGWKGYAQLRPFKHAGRLLENDIRCRRAADTLLGISDWDDDHYWRLLPGRARVRAFPYFSPWPYLRPEVTPLPWEKRRPAIVSMGGNFDPSGLANVANFQSLADRLPKALTEKWSYVLTWWNQWHDSVPDVNDPVQIARDVVEPWDFLCGVRALAVLTPIGFGLKTTVIDGLAAGCHVIVHPTSALRLPRPVSDACVIFDPDADDIEAIAERLSAPPPTDQLNERLRTAAADALRATFSHSGRMAARH
jgi:hypothetical protein